MRMNVSVRRWQPSRTSAVIYGGRIVELTGATDELGSEHLSEMGARRAPRTGRRRQPTGGRQPRQDRARASGVRRGSRQGASAVPTGSTANRKAGRAVVTKSRAESAPRPSRTHGRSTGLTAPVTERASAPHAAGRIAAARGSGQRPSSWRTGAGFPCEPANQALHLTRRHDRFLGLQAPRVPPGR
jgi:hypothetical protein